MGNDKDVEGGIGAPGDGAPVAPAALAVIPGLAVSPTAPESFEPPARLSEEHVELIRRTVCEDATDHELELFLHRCKITRLDPLSGQIYAFKSRGRLTIGTGVGGFRTVAERSGLRDGDDPPLWSSAELEEDGSTKWLEVWPHSDVPPHCCRYTLHKRGASHPYTAIAYFDFYAQFERSGELKPTWRGIGGAQMLAKCAEVAALRKAFPFELSGMYCPEEMEQADNPTRPSSTRPAPSSSSRPSDFAAALDGCSELDELDQCWADECKRRKGKIPSEDAARYRAKRAELEAATESTDG